MSQPPLPPPMPPTTPPPPPPMQPRPPHLPPSPLSTPSQDSGPEVASAEQKALIGLIFGICQFPLMLFCSFVMLACAIPAFILGNQAHAVLVRPEVQSDRRGMALAAKVLGIVGMALGGLILVATVVALVWMFVATSAYMTPPGGGTTP